jgi:hypothetical protein
MEETLDELRSMAARRTGRTPAELMARHVVAITEGGDWPLRWRRAKTRAPTPRVLR